jgi:hypothetical protein
MKYLLLLLLPFTAASQTGSEIYVYDLSVKNGSVVLSNPQNISNHKGYDNQPHFHPTQPLVYFSSFNDSGRSDIKLYNLQSKKLSSFTNTNEREYSPTVTPDQKFISCIVQRDNGTQDLVKFSVRNSKPTVLINTLKVGYHTWIDDHRLLLFVLKNDSLNQLHYYDLVTKEDKIIADNPGRSLHRIPGENAFSFVQKSKTEKWLLKRYDGATGQISVITELPNAEDVAWLKNGLLLLSESDHISVYDTKSKQWNKVVIEGDQSFVKKISRMSVSADNKRVTIVVVE